MAFFWCHGRESTNNRCDVMWRHPRPTNNSTRQTLLKVLNTASRISAKFLHINCLFWYKIPNKCVVCGCSNVLNLPEGVLRASIALLSRYKLKDKNWLEAKNDKKRRKARVIFAKTKRVQWEHKVRALFRIFQKTIRYKI